MLVVVAPGQGAQAPGMLSRWLDLPGLAEQVAAWSGAIDLDLEWYGTCAGADEIRDTAIAQPLLVATALAGAQALFGHLADVPRCVGAVAGHSVGEFAAAALAGVLDPREALRLVRARGKAMAEAAATTDGGMIAVLGGEPAAVLGSLRAHGVTPANINCAGQVVAAGTAEQLAALTADPPKGARLRPLAVAGAFHTHHMASAVARLRAEVDGVPVTDPQTGLLSNRDGAIVRRGAEFLDRLVDQVSAPVRWDLCLRTMSEQGVSAIIELPPAGTLTGIARRALPGVELLALKDPGDLDRARALVAAHATAAEQHPPEWRLLVAPLRGTFRGEGTPAGSVVPAGAKLGRVVARSDEYPVVAPWAATILEWLVEDDDPVSAGRPIVRLHPEEEAA